MCPYIGIPAGFLYTPQLQFFFHLQVGGFWGFRPALARVA
jgi:hypothetical protein